MTPESFCYEMTDVAACEQLKSCGLVAAQVACVWGWEGTGERHLGRCPGPGVLGEALDAGRLRFDALLAAQCLEELPGPCGPPPSSCAQALVGTVPVGGTCFGSNECATGLKCVGDACPTTCQPPRCGEAVELSDGGCEPSVACDGGCPRGLAQTCEAAAPCGDGLRCVEGRCLFDRAAEGQACDLQLPCQLGLSCTAGQCTRGQAEGAPCDSSRPCAFTLSCTASGCISPGGAQAACDEGNARCRAHFHCVDQRCASDLGAGEPCVRAQECETGLQCLAGRCQDSACR